MGNNQRLKDERQNIKVSRKTKKEFEGFAIGYGETHEDILKRLMKQQTKKIKKEDKDSKVIKLMDE